MYCRDFCRDCWPAHYSWLSSFPWVHSWIALPSLTLLEVSTEQKYMWCEPFPGLPTNFYGENCNYPEDGRVTISPDSWTTVWNSASADVGQPQTFHIIHSILEVYYHSSLNMLRKLSNALSINFWTLKHFMYIHCNL